MITLAFDSTAKTASAAIADGEKIIAVTDVDNGLTQSELLLPMAESLLSSAKLSFSDIELLACSVGPGSFTGVRIGAALVKGIAFGKNIPCVGVSTLEALAENLRGLSGIIVPVMDARRSQVYTALFSGKSGEVERLTDDSAISLSELSEVLRPYSEEGESIYLVGDGYEVSMEALSGFGISLADTPKMLRAQSAASIARLAYRRRKAELTVSDRDIKPTYLRLPQAERERLNAQHSKETETAK